MRYITNGMNTLLNDDGTVARFVAKLGESLDDRKIQLDAGTFKLAKFPLKGELIQNKRPLPFEVREVSATLLTEIEHWPCLCLNFQGDYHPYIKKWPKGREITKDNMKKHINQEEKTDNNQAPLAIGSNMTDIQFDNNEKYDPWMANYVQKCSKPNIRIIRKETGGLINYFMGRERIETKVYASGYLKVVTASLFAQISEEGQPNIKILLEPVKDFYAWCGPEDTHTPIKDTTAKYWAVNENTIKACNAGEDHGLTGNVTLYARTGEGLYHDVPISVPNLTIGNMYMYLNPNSRSS